MRICLYGLPSAGKTYILEKIDFLKVSNGSQRLYEINQEFEKLSENEQNIIRKELALKMLSEDNFIMDGHYILNEKVVFTQEDGTLYDTFLYLYVDPSVIEERMKKSKKNNKYIKYDIKKWQYDEIEGLREYCHINNKDFYILDNPPINCFEDVTEVIDFIREIKSGFSCVNYARNLTKSILENNNDQNITLTDGDKTVTLEDTSNKILKYITQIFEGNFYTGYQFWKQWKDFKKFIYKKTASFEMDVGFNEKVLRKLPDNAIIITSGHCDIWKDISKHLNMTYYCGNQMAAETKYFIAKFLQEAGKIVIAYGDSLNDYYMLRQANKGYLVTKQDGSISRSLRNKDFGGIEIV